MRLDRLWTWIAIALPAIVALVVPLPSVDLAYQVRAGSEILATGVIPRADTWTFTVYGTAWTDQQWLAQVLLAFLHRLGGWESLAVARALLVASMTGILVATARSVGARPRTAAILSLAAFAIAAPALALRPQLLGVVICTAVLWLVAGRARRPTALVIGAPLLAALWANVHGSFVLVPAVLGWAWLDDVAAGRSARASLWAAVLGTAATLASPFTVGAWLYAAGIGANPVIAGQVSEWQRTTPFEMPGLLFYPSVAIAAVLLARPGRAVGWPSWLFLFAMAAIGTWAVRGVAWWALAMVPLVASPVAPPEGSLAIEGDAAATARGTGSRLNLVTAGLLGVVLVAALPGWRPADSLTGRSGLLSYAPSGIASELASMSSGSPMRVVVPQTWASWFEWAAPDATYFIDSRFELYPSDVWADLAAFARGDGEAVLDRWRVDAIVVAAGHWTPGGDWDQVYADIDGVILVRRP